MKLLTQRNTKAPLTMHACQICNAVFICLDIYQKHRKEHAKTENVDLLACSYCPYATDNPFHYNWHSMSHASDHPHQCDFCRQKDKNGSGAGNENDLNDPMRPGRISESFVTFGKRSIATQSSSDDLNSPPPPHQLHIPPKTIENRGNIYQNLEHIENNQLDDNEFEENNGDARSVADDVDEPPNAEEEDNDDDNETEEEDEDKYSSINECDIVNGGSANYQENEDLIQQQQQQQQQQQNQQYEQQQIYYGDSNQMNGDYEQDDDEDDGTVEDEEAQEMIQQEEQQQQQEYQDYGNNEEYANEDEEDEEEEEEEEEEDDDENTYDNADQSGDGVVEMNNGIDRKSGDVYDFNSDEEAPTPQFQQIQQQQQQQPQQATLLTNGTPMAVPMAAQLQPHPTELHPAIVTAPNGSTHLQLQPAAFVQHPHHPHEHQTGMPPLQPAPPLAPPPHHLQQQQQQHPPPAALQTNQATFQLAPHHLTTQHPHQHHHPTFITLPNGAAGFAVPAQCQPAGNYFQLDPSAANGQIRFVSIPATFNPAQPLHQQPQPQQQHQPHPQQQQHMPPIHHHQHHQPTAIQVPQPLQAAQTQSMQPAPMQQQTLSNVPQTQQPAHQGGQSNATAPRKRSKKSASEQHLPLELNGTPTTNGDIITSINQPFVPTKGKGKGNRKPRINFISVINGITVGADGIRRKFHCSHCGNGKSFKTKSHLQRHMLTHTGEKPYQCNECGSKFNQSSSLRNHIIAIHTKKFPHVCSVCNKGFLMPAVLAKHIQQTNHYAEGGEAVGSAGSSASPGTTQDTNSKDENHYDENQHIENQHNDESLYSSMYSS